MPCRPRWRFQAIVRTGAVTSQVQRGRDCSGQSDSVIQHVEGEVDVLALELPDDGLRVGIADVEMAVVEDEDFLHLGALLSTGYPYPLMPLCAIPPTSSFCVKKKTRTGKSAATKEPAMTDGQSMPRNGSFMKKSCSDIV